MATSRPVSPDLTIVLLGHTGVGKSASGNTILGRAAFESEFSLTSLTTEVNMETSTVFGKKALVCDTPGILGHEDMIKTWVKSVLQLSKQCLFLVVIRIGRFSAGQEKAVRATMAVLGKDGLKHSFLLFTHGDKLGTTSLDDYIFHSPEGPPPGFVQEFSRRTHLFDNVHARQNQVRELLEKSGHLQPYGQGSPLAGSAGSVRSLEEWRSVLQRSSTLNQCSGVPSRSSFSPDLYPDLYPDSDPDSDSDSDSDPDPDPDRDLTIVLLGNSGVGKSASGNTILGRAAFKSKLSSKSVTTKISEESGSVFGKIISVVDTPAIIGSEGIRIRAKCQQLLRLSRPCLFLLVVKLDQFTTEQRKAADEAIRVIGDQGFEYCYLLFTGADRLGSMTLDEFINEDPEGPLKAVVDKFGGRVHLFNNENGGPEQVRDLLLKSGHLQDDFGLAVDAGERRIMLLGFRGAGKSSTGNTILGSEQFGSVCSFDPVTFKTVSRSARVEGRRVKVVDTPGFTDERLSPRKLFDEIRKSIKEAGPGPHAFIIVVSLDKILKEHIKMFRILREMFRKDSAMYAMVVFTNGDRLSGQSMDDLIWTNRHVTKLVTRCGGRYCVFDNTQMANREQVRDLLDKIDQMVADYNVEHCTYEMFRDSQGFLLSVSALLTDVSERFEMTPRRLDTENDGYGYLTEIDSDDDDAYRGSFLMN